ncbi:L-lactate dehydrogenase [Anaerobaca lacustris]|uniref:L-lactate dehydrogenase n=1 Tax=Anaerobaca lacustris TaxID=3044600 RepID=A0AAW6TUT5_9BACT|nr:L-lactate dehydrogenase [Sedimentisphaerales bacterium M17dextr]
MVKTHRKVVVIGAGSVGTTYIYALLQTGLASEIALIDLDAKRVEGEIMDLSHGLPFIPPVSVKAGTYDDCADAHLIVVTAGAKQTPGQSRIELIQKNAQIVQSICAQIRSSGSTAVVLMVTNPVDTLTQVAQRHLELPRGSVIGSGTVLDSARFKYMLSRHCGIDARNVHAYILGEHGDSEVPAWSMTHIAGIPIREYCEICKVCDYPRHHEQIAREVRDSAYHIIDYKGSTFYGIGLSLLRISGAILRDEHSVLTVSTLLEGEYGLKDICLSIPCIVGENGVERIIAARLPAAEQEGLERSAEILRGVLQSVSV